MTEHGTYGQQNRKFLASIYKPQPTEVFMKVSAPLKPLPPKHDMRNITGPIEIYNQGGLGSCTANAIATAYKMMAIHKYRKNVSISRLFVYYNERMMIGKVHEDSGAFIKDGFISMQSQGACLEKFWPYIESQFTVTPPFYCYNEARLHQTLSYNSQLDPSNMVRSIKQCISMNLPVVIGVMVYESFVSDQTAKSGLIPYPNVQTEAFHGGHAICCVGYDDSLMHFIFLNSWGEVWGERGVGYIPYAFVANNDLCNDCHAFLDVEMRLFSEAETHEEVSLECKSPLDLKEKLAMCNTI